ncbi:hypothetical protein ACB087_15700 [Vibrio sp. VNB-15]
MNRKVWLFLAIILLSGPTLLPFGLEVISLIELIGVLGIWSLCSSYVLYLYSHPYTRRFWACITSPEQHLLIFIRMADLKRYPFLFIHLLPYRSVVAWSLPVVFSSKLLLGLGV